MTDMESRQSTDGVGGSKHGFTLVELLVVVGIIALLISILLPALAKARQSATRVQCLSNTRQIAIAAFAYGNDNKGMLPGCVWTGAGSVPQFTHQWYLDFPSQGSDQITGIGKLVQRGYLTPGDLRVIYCPGRDINDPLSYEYNLAPSQAHLSGSDAQWNPGLRNAGSGGSIYLQAGYFFAVSDRGNNFIRNQKQWASLSSPPGTPMVLDCFGYDSTDLGFLPGPVGQAKTGHGGINVTFMDGHGEFLSDPQNVLDQNFYFNANAGYSKTGPAGTTDNQATSSGFDGAGTYINGTNTLYGAGVRWGYSGTSYRTGISYIEHFWLNWTDQAIQASTPGP